MRLYMVDRPRFELGSLCLRGRTSPSKFAIYLAPELGFEPRMTESKSVVLPLHYSGVIIKIRNFKELVCRLRLIC